MKNSAIVALLLASSQAVKLGSEWAIGLDGDEFMNEEISMKGENFKFMQKDTQQVQLASPEDHIKKPDAPVEKKQWTKDNMQLPAERVEIKDPMINRHRTTFYDKQNGVWRQEQEMAQRNSKDIANKEVRPDVYTTVWNNVDPASHWRPEKAPKGQFDSAYKHKDAGVYKVDANGHIVDGSWSAKFAQKEKKVDPISPVNYDPWVYQYSKDNMTPHVQWHDREKGDEAPVHDPRYYHAHESFAQNEPEKVHTLNWEAYKNRADTNKPNTRTTFYDKKNGVYRTQPQMMAQVMEDGDAKKAEEAAEDAKKAAKAAEGKEAQAAAIRGFDPTEKVSVLEPMAYERRYNYALPFSRTTFYSQVDN